VASKAALLGTGWAFPPAFSAATKGASLVSAEEDIEQSLRILLGTTPGERVMQPDYGCNLRRMVFEMINQSALTHLKDTIERAILFFEPRINLELVSIDDSDWIDGVLRIELEYTIITTNTRRNMVYPLYLLEATSVGFAA
jgi:hypothetical protein